MSASPSSIGSVTERLLDQRRALAPGDLRAERQQVVAVGDDRRRRRRPSVRRPRVTASASSSCHSRVAAFGRRRGEQVGQAVERRATRVRSSDGRSSRASCPIADGTISSMPPRPCARIETASSIRTVDGRVPVRGRVEAEQRRQQGRAVGQRRAPLVDDLDLVAFEHRDVDELAAVAAVMLDDQQARGGDLEHEAERRNRARRAPDAQLAVLVARRRGGCPGVRRPARP